MRFPVRTFALCFAFVVCASAWAAPIFYGRTQYQKTKLRLVKDNWLSSAPGEQAGNYSDAYFGFFNTNSAHYWLMDYLIYTVPAFNQIAGVQLALGPENTWRGVAGMYYNCIRSDSDWIQGTQRDLTTPPPEGEPSFLYAQSPSVPWKQGCADLSTLVNDGRAPLYGDSSNIVGVYLVLDLELSVVKDFLEGNAHGICVWGWDAAANGWSNWYFYRQPNELWIYTRLSDTEQKSGQAGFGEIVTAQPNPFNCNTTFQYRVNAQARVVINVYDAQGKLVLPLVNAQQQSGSHSIIWDGKDSRGTSVHSGVYVLKVSINGSNHVKKLIVIK
ncbi:MAG: hypothetical protein A2487_11875 [Candidatus Raymondbacteria bacterium RifOxyC12_full_50_8]|uniref:FlgD/Vpr Ig-like domain-containing protein n=1 Tax=Candidatus Raymondbacteria bacterium RIFOXYD12_FULL_49_13 TaxID=1817890 RepID=A0A1F7F6C0_UNCRA|nr:MAG: hypothetical protein A2248_13055 [Candidatus Raymondbacteria bacterium RIFOXYA2_FULL_49_16]OGJ95733.1 MAG: hypothetical protein A2487_11875 [Candidatus Raymondbacteria bacterium RifOxyC12_full_50_8]OGJ96027.1 MAG: hypothetical protein A2350_04495 [Candidatus Raymondbacteria bacterium RifOxyB12_full_50_8]OGK02215.1 MAG: hypothetical protein A2519_16170 [Candidatus Raymondbacteria bacterium RIFOXYD12_FULL_49_13]OGP45172.1 MAG: hypothetical protein A2324_12300 [Candidatus Raymondbacteria b